MSAVPSARSSSLISVTASVVAGAERSGSAGGVTGPESIVSSAASLASRALS